MKPSRSYVLLIPAILILCNCTDKSTEPGRTPTSTFPLTTDSRWQYQGFLYNVPFNDSSLADTVWKQITRRVIGPDTLMELLNLTVVDDSVITELGPQPDTMIFRYWLKIDSEKLKEYAYGQSHPGSDPDPIVHNYPRDILDFPLSAGKHWTSLSGVFVIANSAVVGTELIQFDTLSIVCDVVLTHTLDTTEGDTILVTYEWYSDEGLIHKELDWGVNEILDESGNLIDSVRSFETWNLVEMDIR